MTHSHKYHTDKSCEHKIKRKKQVQENTVWFHLFKVPNQAKPNNLCLIGMLTCVNGA